MYIIQLYMFVVLTKYTYDIHYKCTECVCRAAPGCRLSCHAPSKNCVREGGPQAILLNIQYTLLMMLHVYIVDQLQVGLHPTIDLTPTAVMQLATMTRMYW